MSPTRHTLALVSLVVITAVLITPGAYAQNSQSNASERTIQGAWRTQITLINCDTGDPLGASLRGLLTFHEGGTLSEFGVAPGSTPAQRSPGHGVWQREHGWQDYSFLFVHYRYNTSGVFIGTQRVTATLELQDDGDHFTTQSAVQALDTNDNVVGAFCATSVGTRIE